MKKIGVAVLAVVMLYTTSGIALASDWDVAGKVLTGIEGLRILSGGRFDVVGNIFGLGRSSRGRHNYGYRHYQERIWVLHYAWERKWVPVHTAYDPAYAEILVEGQYIKYKVENGGHWEYR